MFNYQKSLKVNNRNQVSKDSEVKMTDEEILHLYPSEVKKLYYIRENCGYSNKFLKLLNKPYKQIMRGPDLITAAKVALNKEAFLYLYKSQDLDFSLFFKYRIYFESSICDTALKLYTYLYKNNSLKIVRAKLKEVEKAEDNFGNYSSEAFFKISYLQRIVTVSDSFSHHFSGKSQIFHFFINCITEKDFQNIVEYTSRHEGVGVSFKQLWMIINSFNQCSSDESIEDLMSTPASWVVSMFEDSF